MPWQVYKFGGSSLGTPGRLSQVLDLVARGTKDAPRLALVASALPEPLRLSPTGLGALTVELENLGLNLLANIRGQVFDATQFHQ